MANGVNGQTQSRILRLVVAPAVVIVLILLIIQLFGPQWYDNSKLKVGFSTSSSIHIHINLHTMKNWKESIFVPKSTRKTCTVNLASSSHSFWLKAGIGMLSPFHKQGGQLLLSQSTAFKSKIHTIQADPRNQSHKFSRRQWQLSHMMSRHNCWRGLKSAFGIPCP